MPCYIYTTHTNSTQYVEYAPADPRRNHNVIQRRFTVRGGHGLANKKLDTPYGIMTTVTDDKTMEWLEALPAFQKDIAQGRIVVLKRKEDPEKVVKRSMNPKDGSAPRTPDDYVIVDKLNNIYRSKTAEQGIMV